MLHLLQHTGLRSVFMFLITVNGNGGVCQHTQQMCVWFLPHHCQHAELCSE